MSVQLHVVVEHRLRATFTLTPGRHRLGSSEDADLALPEQLLVGPAWGIQLTPDGEVVIFAPASASEDPDGDDGSEPSALLHPQGTAATDRLLLRCGDSVDVGNPPSSVRLVVLSRSEEDLLEVAPAPQLGLPTAPSAQVIPPSTEPLALVVGTARGRRVVPFEGNALTLGRTEGAGLRLLHPEVSRTHAELFRKRDGLWIRDLSTHGTFLNGTPIREAALPPGSLLRLGSARDAPEILILPLSEALANPPDDDPTLPIRGRDAAMKTVRELVYRYAPGDQPVLIHGETGTGKQLIAEALSRGRNRNERFTTVDCGAIPENLVEGMLFGHRKGAFTGAVSDQIGFFEAAKGGTLFMDEIGELPLELQPRLLRALEKREICRVGETEARPVRFRLVTATHRDLPAMVAAGTFREDLFHRMAVLEIRVPPLRGRREDIADLCRHMLRKQEPPLDRKVLSQEALAVLQAHPWPGNVRELRNVIAHAVVHTDGLEIEAAAIRLRKPNEPTATPTRSLDNLPANLDALVRAHCLEVMARHDNNQRAAARALGITVWSLRRKIETAAPETVS